jgi:PAS domain-containing protein
VPDPDPVAGSEDAAEDFSRVLALAAEAALDLIMVTDDHRRFVDVNTAAAQTFGLTREQFAGRHVDDFFIEAGGVPIPEAWQSFIAEGSQCGKAIIGGRSRTFAYRAKASFTPGLHLAVLHEVDQPDEPAAR